ncbi:MAG: truB [Nevskia sp.]|nr:truB [Nevskia sp.]
MTNLPRRTERRAVDGVLLLDKPAGLTSNAALQRVKRLLWADKAGHTGSLDPLATGLLPICLGQATKLSAYLLDADKTYRASVRLGVKTNTGDADGKPIAESIPHSTSADFEALIPRFLGPIRQIPPMYSAIKREGLKLYKLAREGIEVEREPRDVVIHELRLTAFDSDRFEFEVRCSKGTYVRTLAEDWAAAAGEHAHLSALRRIGLGRFEAAAMVDLQTLEDCADAEARRQRFLQPSLAVLAHWPRVAVTPADERRLRAGTPIPIAADAPAGLLCVVNGAGSLIWLGEHDGQGVLAPRRWLGREVPEESAATTGLSGD